MQGIRANLPRTTLISPLYVKMVSCLTTLQAHHTTMADGNRSFFRKDTSSHEDMHHTLTFPRLCSIPAFLTIELSFALCKGRGRASFIFQEIFRLEWTLFKLDELYFSIFTGNRSCGRLESTGIVTYRLYFSHRLSPYMRSNALAFFLSSKTKHEATRWIFFRRMHTCL